MSVKSDLEIALAEFDGRATTLLSEAAAAHSHRSGYMSALVALCGSRDENVAGGATWLIKDHLENGGALTAAQITNLVASGAECAGWAAKLHLCQSAQYLTFSEADARTFAAFARSLLDHKRPFLRAWSLDALCHLAAQHDAFRAVAGAALKKAAKDPAASVKARARNIAARQK